MMMVEGRDIISFVSTLLFACHSTSVGIATPTWNSFQTWHYLQLTISLNLLIFVLVTLRLTWSCTWWRLAASRKFVTQSSDWNVFWNTTPNIFTNCAIRRGSPWLSSFLSYNDYFFKYSFIHRGSAIWCYFRLWRKSRWLYTTTEERTGLRFWLISGGIWVSFTRWRAIAFSSSRL